MGRAIIREPAAFLMDEPLSNLDAKLRVAMRAEVSRVQRRLGVATLYVTHYQIEAMTMGDRVAVMQDGLVRQCDAPQELYDHPANVFVAAFIGSPSINLYQASLDEGARAVRLGSQSLPLPDRIRAARPGLAAFADKRVVVGLRPEHLPAATGQDRLTLEGEITMVEALGSELLVHFAIDADGYRPEGVADEAEQLDHRGEGVARVAARSPMTLGAKGRFAVDIDGLQFFDPTTGDAV